RQSAPNDGLRAADEQGAASLLHSTAGPANKVIIQALHVLTTLEASSPQPSPPASLGGEGVKRARTGLIPSPREERAGRGTGRGACVLASFSYASPRETHSKRPAFPTRTDF